MKYYSIWPDILKYVGQKQHPKSTAIYPRSTAILYYQGFFWGIITTPILQYIGVSKNSGTTKSSILIGFSPINHSFWGPYVWKYPHQFLFCPFPFRCRIIDYNPCGFSAFMSFYPGGVASHGRVDVLFIAGQPGPPCSRYPHDKQNLKAGY